MDCLLNMLYLAPEGIFLICFLYCKCEAQSLSRSFFLSTACLSNSLLAKAWFSFSILSVSLFRIPIFKLVGPFSDGYCDLFTRFFGAGATELHLPLLISTSLLSKIWLSLLIVRFFSLVRKSLVFFLSSLFFFNY